MHDSKAKESLEIPPQLGDMKSALLELPAQPTGRKKDNRNLFSPGIVTVYITLAGLEDILCESYEFQELPKSCKFALLPGLCMFHLLPGIDEPLSLYSGDVSTGRK